MPPITRLPEAVVVLYAELLDQLRLAENDARFPSSGSFVSKTIRGRKYWYLQKLESGRKTQAYLGAETPELISQIQGAKAIRKDDDADAKHRRELVSMLAAGGAARESAVVAAVLQALVESFVFHSGGVLVGTHAFSCYSNMLGVRFESQYIRTSDIDVAQALDVSIALGSTDAVDVLAKLKSVEPKFFAVPGLDHRSPSTSFKVRGRDLRVDFVTPSVRRGDAKPIPLAHLGVAAQPLDGLDYLIEHTTRAAVVGSTGILVNVPLPARYALHKLWVATNRPVSETSKSRKDVAQAEQLIAVLAHDAPQALQDAVVALRSRRRMWSRVKPAFERVASEHEASK